MRGVYYILAGFTEVAVLAAGAVAMVIAACALL